MRGTLPTVLTVGLACISLGLAACSENPVEPRSAGFLADARPANPIIGLDVIQSVSGSGHLVGAPVDRTVTFNILKLSDGTVSGWYHSVARRPRGGRIRVRVECLTVAGNQAWATGTVVAAIDPGNIGRPYSFRFVDNGEGAGAAPDEIGAARFEAYDCTTRPDLALRALTIGNLKIRG